MEIDLDSVADAVTRAQKLLVAQLKEKSCAPLEKLDLNPESRKALQTVADILEHVERYNSEILGLNDDVAKIRESVAVSSVETLQLDLQKLEASRERQDPKIASRCEAYLAEVAAKKATEARRARSRKNLDHHLAQVFPAFQVAINAYLSRLNAGFRIDGVKALNSRRGPSCVYNIVIDSCPSHPISVTQDTAGEPSFKTALSTSDRNTLALAVFLASVEMDSSNADSIVIIDDPINSLDEHRQYATLVEIRKLVQQVSQVIVLSHNRPLVCNLWETKGQIGKAAIELARAGTGTILRIWDVSTHGVTEHDKRHAKLREYLINQGQNSREIAEAIRPTLEAFLRVAYPGEYPPGTLLGTFIVRCGNRVGGVDEILAQYDIDELTALKDYGNRFHHDTNAAYQTADINDAELLQFVRRTLNFTKR